MVLRVNGLRGGAELCEVGLSCVKVPMGWVMASEAGLSEFNQVRSPITVRRIRRALPESRFRRRFRMPASRSGFPVVRDAAIAVVASAVCVGLGIAWQSWYSRADVLDPVCVGMGIVWPAWYSRTAAIGVVCDGSGIVWQSWYSRAGVLRGRAAGGHAKRGPVAVWTMGPLFRKSARLASCLTC